MPSQQQFDELLEKRRRVGQENERLSIALAKAKSENERLRMLLDEKVQPPTEAYAIYSLYLEMQKHIGILRHEIYRELLVVDGISPDRAIMQFTPLQDELGMRIGVLVRENGDNVVMKMGYVEDAMRVLTKKFGAIVDVASVQKRSERDTIYIIEGVIPLPMFY